MGLDIGNRRNLMGKQKSTRNNWKNSKKRFVNVLFIVGVFYFRCLSNDCCNLEVLVDCEAQLLIELVNNCLVLFFEGPRFL